MFQVGRTNPENRNFKMILEIRVKIFPTLPDLNFGQNDLLFQIKISSALLFWVEIPSKSAETAKFVFFKKISPKKKVEIPRELYLHIAYIVNVIK